MPEQQPHDNAASEPAELGNRAARRAQRHGKKASSSQPPYGGPAQENSHRAQLHGSNRRSGRRGNR